MVLLTAGPPVRRVETPWVYSWMTTPASKLLSRLGVDLSQTYILMRPDWPSGGVAKFALFVPDPSWVLRMTISLPAFERLD